MAGIRRKARIVALQTLFEIDSVGHPVDEVLAHTLEETPLNEEGIRFARNLVYGVLDHLDEIDHLIQLAAPTWPLSQMSGIDKNILRLAIFEILYNEGRTPAKAAINEAVELAKLFGSDNSSRFVNGVLGTVVNQTENGSSQEHAEHVEPQS